jgi:putative oxidoreductase
MMNGRPARALHQLLSALNAFPLWPLQTFARAALAGVFLQSAINKLESWQITLVLFRDEYRVPLLPYDLAAKLATLNEAAGAILLIAGFATRLATLPLLGMTAVIEIFVYPDAWSEHLTWATLLLLLLLRGAGPLSFDYLLSRVVGRSAVPLAA